MTREGASRVCFRGMVACSSKLHEMHRDELAMGVYGVRMEILRLDELHILNTCMVYIEELILKKSTHTIFFKLRIEPIIISGRRYVRDKDSNDLGSFRPASYQS